MAKKLQLIPPPKGEIMIYQSKQGPQIGVRFAEETIWLTQEQIAGLFDTERTSITKHLNNVVKSGELDEKSNVQILHIANSDKPVKYYNLDFIISVGYRANSKKATEFRRWATKILSEHVRKGFTLNQNRIKELELKQIKEFEQALVLLERAKEKALSGDEARGLIEVIGTYARSWLLLYQYDEGKLEIGKLSSHPRTVLTYDMVLYAIDELRANLAEKGAAGDLFGQERDHGLESILNSIEQSFGGHAVYPSIEEKAAHLMYFIIKDHVFSDGNKRIGSLLFLQFLTLNRYMLNRKGGRKISDNTLVALALLIAESEPDQKEVMVKLIVNFLKP